MSMLDKQREGLVASAKLGTVWVAVGITTWADFAAFMAAIYSVLLVGEFAWKKMLRPFAEWRGWIKSKDAQ